jgi:hypothetical protein
MSGKRFRLPSPRARARRSFDAPHMREIIAADEDRRLKEKILHGLDESSIEIIHASFFILHHLQSSFL